MLLLVSVEVFFRMTDEHGVGKHEEIVEACDVIAVNASCRDRAWCPRWAMKWDVFAGRYGGSDSCNPHEWKRVVPSTSLRQNGGDDDDQIRNNGGWMDMAKERLPAMVTSLEMSLVSMQNPWMTPKHMSQEPMTSDRQRPRLLFQYKPYIEQDRLVLSDSELSGAIDAVFSQESSSLHEARDAGMVILVKIVIDAYLEKGPEIAFQQVFSLLKKPLSDGRQQQLSVFDVIINLMIHGELLYSNQSVQSPTKGEGSGDWGAQIPGIMLSSTVRYHKEASPTCAPWPPISKGEFVHAGDVRVEQFREWLRRLLFQLISHLGTIENRSTNFEDSGSEVWASVFSCMTSLCTYEGYFVQEYMQHLPLHALRRMLHVSRHAFWATSICSILKSLLCNILYSTNHNEDSDLERAVLDFEKIEEFGGIQHIVKEYYYAPTVMSSQSLFCVLLDYVLNAKLSHVEDPPSQGATWGFSINETFEVHVVAHALLNMKAAAALKDYLLLPAMDSDANINRQLSHVIHSEIVTMMGSDMEGEPAQGRVPLAFVEYCITALKQLTSKSHCIPDTLESNVKSTCEAGVFGESDSENWRLLENALLSDSSREQGIGRSWLVKLMVSASDREIEEAWVSRKSVIPPPVPLMPSSTPERDLFTCGDTILSALAKSKSKIHGQGSMFTYRRFEGDDFVVTNFALAIRHVVSAMRFRMLDLPGDLHTKWSNGAVDTNRLCISTIERAFEWIFGFSSAPEWSTAIALLAECLISTIAVCDIVLPSSTKEEATMHSPDDAIMTAADATPKAKIVQEEEMRQESVTVAPLHIPNNSPDQETDMLSPLSKLVPGAPKLAAAWRRLRTPGGSSRNRPTSAESNADDELAESRPLSAGVMKMDSTRSKSSRADSIFTRESISQHATPGYHQTLPRSTWRSLEDKVRRRKEDERKAYMDKFTRVCNTVLAFEQTIDTVESFITGISSCPVYILEIMSPQMLKDIFDAMNQVDIDGVKLMESSSRQAAVQAGKPFWDSRLAIFILLVDSFTMTEKNQYNHPLLKTPGYVQALLRDPDARVRHHACSFILNRFCQQDKDGYIKALATIVSRAQQSNDDRLLRDPESQVNKMLEMRLFDMSVLMLT